MAKYDAPTLKVLVAGDPGSGKANFINKFLYYYPSSAKVHRKSDTKHFMYVPGKDIKIQLHDVIKVENINPNSYDEVDVVFFCYGANDSESLQSLEKWIGLMRAEVKKEIHSSPPPRRTKNEMHSSSPPPRIKNEMHSSSLRIKKEMHSSPPRIKKEMHSSPPRTKNEMHSSPPRTKNEMHSSPPRTKNEMNSSPLTKKEVHSFLVADLSNLGSQRDVAECLAQKAKKLKEIFGIKRYIESSFEDEESSSSVFQTILNEVIPPIMGETSFNKVHEESPENFFETYATERFLCKLPKPYLDKPFSLGFPICSVKELEEDWPEYLRFEATKGL